MVVITVIINITFINIEIMMNKLEINTKDRKVIDVALEKEQTEKYKTHLILL